MRDQGLAFRKSLPRDGGDRFDARAKLSQNKPAEVRDRITTELAAHNPALADEMRRTPGSA